jgi:hypothetical protein
MAGETVITNNKAVHKDAPKSTARRLKGSWGQLETRNQKLETASAQITFGPTVDSLMYESCKDPIII